jgi:hypothetical protein
MIEELLRGVKFLEKVTKVPNENKKKTAKFLRDLESCVTRYKQALSKRNESAMLQIQAEFEEIIYAFQRRLFVVIDKEQDAKLMETMAVTLRLEGDVPGHLPSEETKPELLQVLNILLGKLRGLRKTLTAT